MKTLQSKLSAPIIIMLVLIPVLIMMLFNITTRIYVNRTTAEELRNVVQNTKKLSAQLMSADFFADDSWISEEKLQKLWVLRSALQVSRYSMNTEIVILNKEKVLFPQNYAGTFLSPSLINKASLKTERTVSRVYEGRSRYLVFSESVKLPRGNGKILFIASAASADGLIRTMNLFLILTLIASTLIGVFFTISISKKLALPVTDAARSAAKIGNGEFVTLEQSSDCAEIDQLIRGINEMSRKLKASDAAQKTFLQNASHELRTPLMSIQGYAEGLAKGVFVDTAKTAEVISAESQRLNTLVEELLTLSRIEAGSYSGQFEIINLPDALKDYTQKADGYAAMQGKNIELSITADPLKVKADEDLLFKAVYNILTNAVKYAKSTVLVSVLQNASEVIVRIKDDGSGIAEADLPRIFERFYKGRNGNFGLGLAIAKNAVEFINGKIKAYNEDGAVFEIILPLAE